MFTSPKPGFSIPFVTSDFLRGFVSARFQIDHLVTPSGQAAAPAVRGLNPGTWTLLAPGGSTATYAVTLDVFRILQNASANTDGTFTTIAAVTLTDGSVVPSGARGALQAWTEPTGARTALIVSVPGDAAIMSEPEPSAVAAVKPQPTKRPRPDTSANDNPAAATA